MMQDEASPTSGGSTNAALNESLQQLGFVEIDDDSPDADYVDFAIDSDEDDDTNTNTNTNSNINTNDDMALISPTSDSANNNATEIPPSAPSAPSSSQSNGIIPTTPSLTINNPLTLPSSPPPPPTTTSTDALTPNDVEPPPTTSNYPLKKQSVNAMEDPLWSPSANGDQEPMRTFSIPPPRPNPNLPHHLKQSFQQQQLGPRVEQPPHYLNPVGAGMMSNIVSSKNVQSFTSGLSSFASMAANSLQDAVSTAQRVNSTVLPTSGGVGSNMSGAPSDTVSPTMGGGKYSGMGTISPGTGGGSSGNVGELGQSPRQNPPATNGMLGMISGVGGGRKKKMTTTTTTAAGPTIYNSAVGGGMNHQQVPDMDNAKKTALITSAMGKLLPGERVIVFLPSLIGVRDSSFPHTEVGSKLFRNIDEDDQTEWCCAITYYRLIIFSYRRCDFNDLLQPETTTTLHTNTHSNSTAEKEAIRLEKLLQTASTSRQHQHLQTATNNSQQYHNRRHYVLQMPLASIERVTRLSEKKTNSSSSPSLKLGGYEFDASSIGVGGVSLVSGINAGVGAGGGGGVGMMGNSVSPAGLIVYGKDNGRTIQFSTYQDCSKAIESLTTFAFPGGKNLGYLFAFESRRADVMASVNQRAETGGSGGGAEEGNNDPTKKITPLRATARRYDALLEFHRMGVLQPRQYPALPTTDNDATFPSLYASTPQHQEFPSPWRPILKANADYALCPTYPSVLFGPTTVNEDQPEGLRLIRETAAFRCGGRMQTLSWASRHDGASLWRAAQPKVGLQGNRSPADELYVRRIGEAADLANVCAASMGGDRGVGKRPEIGFLKMLTGGINEIDLIGGDAGRRCMVKIMDLRPKSAAIGNRTAGYGYENTSHYKNMTLSFHGIGNIHAVRDSYQKLSHLCTSPATNDVQWGQLVEETKWLYHIRLILSSSWQAAFHVRYNRLPVVVHCSHGWDRTSQVCALSQLLLDSYYRTRVGFSCLIEKEFLALGHPFHTRCGHGEGRGDVGSSSGQGGGDNGQISPIFIQFVDCVFQIVNQYPDYFEFNTKYLLLLSEHVYSCRFGTLLCDSERERETVASIRQRTPCLWEYLDSFPDLINPYYLGNKKSKEQNDGDEDVDGSGGTLMMPLPTLLRNVTLWVDRHCMHGPKPTLRCLPADVLVRDNEHPLLEKNDLNGYILENALAEASKWKKIAEEKEEELQLLKTASVKTSDE